MSDDCDDCRHYQEGGTCSQVEGKISPDGWCMIFNSKNPFHILGPAAEKPCEATEETEGMPSYKIGTNYVPKTGPAIVHRGERIVPAERHADAEDGSPDMAVPYHSTKPARKGAMQGQKPRSAEGKATIGDRSKDKKIPNRRTIPARRG